MPLIRVDEKKYFFTLFYQNLHNGQSNPVFVKADCKQAQTSGLIDPWTMPQMQYIVDYPIIMYTDCSDPKGQRVFAVNMIKNQP
jgi:hypothetical protein